MDKDPAYEGVDVLILYAWSSVASSTSKFNFGIAWILSGAGSYRENWIPPFDQLRGIVSR